MKRKMEEGGIRCVQFLPRRLLNLSFRCWQKAQVLRWRLGHLWSDGCLLPGPLIRPGLSPTAPWVFLVRCVDCTDRVHSFGLEPLGRRVIFSQCVPKILSEVFAFFPCVTQLYSIFTHQ